MALTTLTARVDQKDKADFEQILLQCRVKYIHRDQSFCESSFARKTHPV